MLSRNIIQRKNINSYNSNKNKHAKYAMQLLLPVPHKACTHLHIPTINYRVLKFKRYKTRTSFPHPGGNSLPWFFYSVIHL